MLETINDFFISITKKYREVLKSFYKGLTVPLFFVIEDSQFIDELSIQLIREYRDNVIDDLCPFSIIITYQVPFSDKFKNPGDVMSKASDLIEDIQFYDHEIESSSGNTAGFIMENLVEQKDIQD